MQRENPGPWYAVWRVWVSMALMLLISLAGCVIGAPFRILDSLWQWLF